MNWTQIQQLLISLVLPALVSIIVVLFNNARQKKLEFEYDYRKYLLDKRKKTYDEVEKILNTLNDAYGLDEHWLWRLEKEELYHIVSFNDSISDVLANGIWLSDEIINILRSFNLFFLVSFRKVHEKEAIPSILELQNNMTGDYTALIKVFFKDISELDKVNEFKKRKMNLHQVESRMHPRKSLFSNK